MSHPGAADAVDGARQIEIVDATWERIQVTLRLRPADGRPLDLATVRLRSATRGSLTCPPTSAIAQGSEVLLRINVMQGPGQMPYDAGRWFLEAPGRDGLHRPLVAAGDAVPSEAVAEFPLVRGVYRARLGVDPGDRAVSLWISLGAGGLDPAEAPSRFATLTRPIRRLRPLTFRVLLRLIRAVSRRNGRRILFTSDSRTELGGNLKIVHDRMVERGLDRDYELLTLFKDSITVRRSFADRLRLPWLLARADAIVTDDYQPAIYWVDDPGARIVQLWHAWGAFKTVGYSRVGKPGGPSPYSRIHKNYTYAIVSSTSEVPFYAEAFGIPESRVIPTGIPRMDQFFDRERAAASRERALDAYPAARGRMTILFAPTFRGHGAKSAWYDIDLLDHAALHAVCVEKDAVCIIRMHPFVRTPLDVPEAYADRIIDGSSSSIDINEVLFATDLLITDYSSVVFEFSTADRPMLFFAYDLEEYVASRDFYVRYEDFVPGRIVRTFDELLDALRRDDYQVERLAAFRAEHLDHFDGQATDRVIDLILGT